MDARYLGSAIAITLLSSVSIRVWKSAILEQRPSFDNLMVVVSN